MYGRSYAQRNHFHQFIAVSAIIGLQAFLFLGHVCNIFSLHVSATCFSCSNKHKKNKKSLGTRLVERWILSGNAIGVILIWKRGSVSSVADPEGEPRVPWTPLSS